MERLLSHREPDAWSLQRGAGVGALARGEGLRVWDSPPTGAGAPKAAEVPTAHTSSQVLADGPTPATDVWSLEGPRHSHPIRTLPVHL